MTDSGSGELSSALVVGGGVGGVQAALDLADVGLKVYLVERAPAIGGYMAMLDKTFPTNDCSMCILSPKLVSCARHPNIELLTLSEVLELIGEPGGFQVRVRQFARSVDLSRCTGCGSCFEKCPVKLPNEFEGGLSQRRAIYRLYAQAVPNAPTIDRAHCLKFTKNRCGNCEKVCKAGAINYAEEDREVVLNISAVVLALGSEIVRPEVRQEFGYGRLANVVTSLEFERILSASGPFGGHIQRPSDKREPNRIAWVQCFGSRDETVERPYCSSVCCMYAVKEAVIAKEHAPEVQPTIFYIDIRAFGKDFDRYIERAERQYGVRMVPARVAEIREEPETKDLILRYATEEGQSAERFDMVVLSCGFVPPESVRVLDERLGVALNRFSYPAVDLFAPVSASRAGVFLAGSGQGPKDIPETVTQASAAVANVLRYCRAKTVSETGMMTKKKGTGFRNIAGEPPRIGVFVCHCGINIGGVVRVSEVVEFAENLPGVVSAEENLYSCSVDSLEKLKARIAEQNINRVVVASCSPRTHEPLFQVTVAEAGLNPHLFAMANIRDQCSWVHTQSPDEATEKAKELVRMAVARVRRQEPLAPVRLPVTKAGLVIGGGIAGMSAALALGDAGFDVFLVERERELGGIARNIWRTIEGEDIQKRLADMIERVGSHPRVRVFTNAQIAKIEGFVGSFTTTVNGNGTPETLKHGVVILATGAVYCQPDGKYGYGKSPAVVTQKELEQMLHEQLKTKNNCELRTIVMIQCVGSRDEERPFCSRICCVEAIKNAIAIKGKSPATEVFILYRDIRTYGLKEQFYRQAREMGVHFIRYTPDKKPVVVADESGVRLKFYEPILGEELELTPDLLVLSSGLVANPDAAELAKALKVPLHQDGFFLEAHVKLRPVDFATEGVFLCGLCHYPKFIDETVASAQAAAGRAITILSREFIESEPYQAVVKLERCSACGMCEGLCAYRAIELPLVDERGGKRAAVVNSALCKGCGTCAANCRSQAIDIKGFSTENIFREIAALFTSTSSYHLLDHTADLKVEIYGKDLPQLFANAAFMLFDVMVDITRVRESAREEVELSSPGLDELFLDWFRELLYRFSTKGFITKRVDIKELKVKSQRPKVKGYNSSNNQELTTNNCHLSAFIYGENYDPSRHGLKIEIKTPTYHQFQLQKEEGNFKATVVFDV